MRIGPLGARCARRLGGSRVDLTEAGTPQADCGGRGGWLVSSGPRVFISYAWENEAHSAWVEQLATRLRDAGADVLLDKWFAQPGADLAVFMERAVAESDFVIPVCTPEYKIRSEGTEDRGSGVFFEVNIMRSQALVLRRWDKFVPVLRWGRWPEASPVWLLSSHYIPLTDADEPSGFPRLVKRVLGEGGVAAAPAATSSGLLLAPIRASATEAALARELEDDLYLELAGAVDRVRRDEESKDPIRAGRRAGVSHVLASTLRRRNDRLVLNAVLLEVENGKRVLKKEVERDAGDPETSPELVRALSPAVAECLTSAVPAPRRRLDPDVVLRHAVGAWRSADPEASERWERRVRDTLETEPERADLWAVLALLLLTRWRVTEAPGLPDEARAAIERATRADDVPDLARLARWAWSMAREDSDASWAAADDFAGAQPDTALSHLLLAETHLARGDLERAEHEVDTAIRLEPFGHADAYRLRSTLRKKLGMGEASQDDEVLSRLADLGADVVKSSQNAAT